VDNAGENKALKAFLTANGFANVEFAFTPRNNPQFNGRIERKIAVLWSRTKSLLNTAKLPQWLQNGLWPKAFLHSIFLENVIVPTNKAASAYKLFHGEDCEGLNHLHIFGEVAVVKGSNKIQSKLKNKGLPLLYCGIARDHAAACFTFLNPKTKKYVESRDVNLWLNQTYGEYEGLSPPSQLSTVVHVPLENDADNLQELEDIENMPPLPNVPATNVPPSDASMHSNNNNQADAPPELFSPVRTIQSPVAKRMVCELQPHLLDPIEDQDANVTQENENVRVTRSRKGVTDLGDAHATMAYLAMCSKYDDFLEFAVVAIEKYDLKVSLTQNQFSTIPQKQYKDYFTVPETWTEAWNHPCPFQRKLWRDAVQKELDKMESNKVYRKCNKSDLPAGRRPIKCKWVFDIKINGVFRARLVAKGFTQQPGLDYYYQFSPVINDITFQIWLTCVLVWQLKTLVFLAMEGFPGRLTRFP